MSIQARLKDSVTMKSIVACGGIVFYKDWQDVPFWEEVAALNSPYLETREVGGETSVKEEVPVVEEVEEEVPVVKAEKASSKKVVEKTEEISLKKTPEAGKKKGQKPVDEISFDDLTK